MADRLPSPPIQYDQRWASDFVRVLDFALYRLSQPVGVGYQSQVASPLRTINAGDGTSAVGEVGTVQITIAGAENCRVEVGGVGGTGSFPDNAEISRVLATFLADAKARGLIG